MRPVLTAVILSTFAMLGIGPAVSGDDAGDVAQKIYRIVERSCPEDGEGVPYNLAEVASRYFLPDLNEALRQAYEQHTLGFDILIDAQDCAIDDVDIDVDGDEEERGQVLARAEFRNFGEPRVVNLLLVSGAYGWKVADIAYGHRDWQLRRELAAVPAK
jgi:hypothetical protein